MPTCRCPRQVQYSANEPRARNQRNGRKGVLLGIWSSFSMLLVKVLIETMIWIRLFQVVTHLPSAASSDPGSFWEKFSHGMFSSVEFEIRESFIFTFLSDPSPTPPILPLFPKHCTMAPGDTDVGIAKASILGIPLGFIVTDQQTGHPEGSSYRQLASREWVLDTPDRSHERCAQWSMLAGNRQPYLLNALTPFLILLYSSISFNKQSGVGGSAA